MYSYHLFCFCQALTISVLYCAHSCKKCSLDNSNFLEAISAAAVAAKSLQSCPTLCNPIYSSPPGSPPPWDSPGKNTGVGCHFLLQCTKVKSESEVAQLCLTLSDPMDCNLPGSYIHGIFQARVLEWVAIAFSSILANWLQMINLIYECSYAIFWVRLHIYNLSQDTYIGCIMQLVRS